MTLLPKALLVVAVLGLAACNNPDRFGAGGADGAGGAGGFGAGGVDTTGLGDPNDPTSIAYFNQAVGDRVLFWWTSRRCRLRRGWCCRGRRSG